MSLPGEELTDLPLCLPSPRLLSPLTFLGIFLVGVFSGIVEVYDLPCDGSLDLVDKLFRIFLVKVVLAQCKY